MDHTKDGDLAMERQRVLGCQSMQASGAGVESYAPSTEPGDCKGVLPFARVLLGTFLGGTRKVRTFHQSEIARFIGKYPPGKRRIFPAIPCKH